MGRFGRSNKFLLLKTHGENDVGETGIWIPNLEKQGAESTALAASAGGVIAVGGSNYAGGAASAGTRQYTNPDGNMEFSLFN